MSTATLENSPLPPKPATVGVPPLAAGSVPSRFVDREGTLRRAEAWCEDIDSTDEEDRYWDEHMALALWDEMRRLRLELEKIAAMADVEPNNLCASQAKAALSPNDSDQPRPTEGTK